MITLVIRCIAFAFGQSILLAVLVAGVVAMGVTGMLPVGAWIDLARGYVSSPATANLAPPTLPAAVSVASRPQPALALPELPPTVASTPAPPFESLVAETATPAIQDAPAAETNLTASTGRAAPPADPAAIADLLATQDILQGIAAPPPSSVQAGAAP